VLSGFEAVEVVLVMEVSVAWAGGTVAVVPAGAAVVDMLPAALSLWTIVETAVSALPTESVVVAVLRSSGSFVVVV